MLATVRFRKALRIIEKWPLDPTKSERRDIGCLLRRRIQAEFRNGEKSEIEDPELCDKMLKSLENIANNRYKVKYAVQKKYGAMNLTYEDTKGIVSEVGLAAVRVEADMGMLARTFHRLTDGRYKKDQPLEISAPHTERLEDPDKNKNKS